MKKILYLMLLLLTSCFSDSLRVGDMATVTVGCYGTTNYDDCYNLIRCIVNNDKDLFDKYVKEKELIDVRAGDYGEILKIRGECAEFKPFIGNSYYIPIKMLVKRETDYRYKYHNKHTGKPQKLYKNSIEQQRDLDEIDRRMSEDENF